MDSGNPCRDDGLVYNLRASGFGFKSKLSKRVLKKHSLKNIIYRLGWPFATFFTEMGVPPKRDGVCNPVTHVS
jgi:hypothetical protein